MKRIFILLSLFLFTMSGFAKDACAPDNVSQDKITKETFETWQEKLASSSMFKSASNGKADFLYYIMFYKSSKGSKGIALNLSQTTAYVKELFGEDAQFKKGDKILIGWQDKEPLELTIDNVQSQRKVYTASKSVLNSYSLFSEIKEEDYEKLKDYFYNDFITGLRIVSEGSSVVETEVNGKKNTKVSSKAKCFFDSLEK